MEGHREEAGASRGLRGFDELTFSWLDVRLGLRMLAKYPGLTIVSVVGMAVAIALGAGGYELIGTLLDRDVPLPAGDRIVSIQNNTSNPGNPDRRLLHDFEVWREEVGSIRDLGLFDGDRRNLITPDSQVTLESVAIMSAAGFRVARVGPVLGRTLTEADEEHGAPPVLVISYEEWRRRFGGNPDIIGSMARLGNTPNGRFLDRRGRPRGLTLVRSGPRAPPREGAQPCRASRGNGESPFRLTAPLPAPRPDRSFR